MKKLLIKLIFLALIFGLFASSAIAGTTYQSKQVSLPGGVLYPTVDPVTGKTFLVSPTGGNFDPNTVTILDAKNKVEKTITLNGIPYYGTFAVSPVSKELYVTMFQPKSPTTIYAINTNTDSVKEMSLGTEASNMAYDSDRKEMNILVKESNVWHLVALDSSDKVVSDITIAPTYSTEMVYDPNNKSIDIIDGVAQKIYIVDTATKNITTLSVSKIGSPFYNGVLYNPINKNVYALGQNNTITVIHGNEIIGSIVIPDGISNLSRLGLNPVTGYVYVSGDYFGGFAYQIKDVSISGSKIKLNTDPTNFAYDPDDGNMYVVDYTASNITVLSPSSTIINVISLSTAGINPQAIVYNPVTRGLHVPLSGKGSSAPSDYIFRPIIK